MLKSFFHSEKKLQNAILRAKLNYFDFATHTATANTLIYFRFVVDACSELNLRQANCLSSIFYLKFRFDTQ